MCCVLTEEAVATGASAGLQVFSGHHSLAVQLQAICKLEYVLGQVILFGLYPRSRASDYFCVIGFWVSLVMCVWQCCWKS